MKNSKPWVMVMLMMANGISAAPVEPQVAAGGHQTLFIKADGSLWAWGACYGVNPVRIGSDSDWREISMAQYPQGVTDDLCVDTKLALKSDGTLWAWGGNGYGQLGLGDRVDRTEPTQVETGRHWSMISAGVNHALALRRDGTLWAWGSNGYGSLGTGDITVRLRPVRVGPRRDWSAVAAGYLTSHATTRDGSLWAWGNNTWGQLGLGDKVTHLTPTAYPGEWSRLVATNGRTAVAMKADHTLWSWEPEFDHLLPGPLPAQMTTLKRWLSVDTGYVHYAALRGDGTLWTWGSNGKGQLGRGEPGRWYRKARPVEGDEWLDVAAGNYHTVARRLDGSVWAWGWDYSGQLGRGYAGYDSVVPVQVDAANHVAVARTPARGDFGTLGFGSMATLPITLTNSDPARNFIISGMVTRGPFGMSHDCPAALLPGASCTVTAKIDINLSGGAHHGAVAVLSPSVFAGEVTINLSAHVAAARLRAAAVSFADTASGTTTSGVIEIGNGGTQPLAISSLLVSGAPEFSFDASACVKVLAPDETCRMPASFTPGSAGVFTATVAISSDDPVRPEHTMVLSGLGR